MVKKKEGRVNSTMYEDQERRREQYGKCISRKTEILRCTAAVALRYITARPFHATFTILFYFQRYISLDFIARPGVRTTGVPEILTLASSFTGIY